MSNRIMCFFFRHWWVRLVDCDEGVDVVQLEFCSRCGKVK